MLTVYDRARELRPDRAIVEQTVKAAMHQLDAGLPVSPALPPAGPGPGPADEPDDDGYEDQLSDEMNDLLDRLNVLRRHVDDLRLNVEDPVLARRELRNIEEELDQVRAAMTVAYDDGQSSVGLEPAGHSRAGAPLDPREVQRGPTSQAPCSVHETCDDPGSRTPTELAHRGPEQACDGSVALSAILAPPRQIGAKSAPWIGPPRGASSRSNGSGHYISVGDGLVVGDGQPDYQPPPLRPPLDGGGRTPPALGDWSYAALRRGAAGRGHRVPCGEGDLALAEEAPSGREARRQQASAGGADTRHRR
jgi:hypothetical protein